MISIQLDGFYSNEVCKKIKEKFQCKIYMDFKIESGGVGGNNTIVISSEKEIDKDELKEMFYYVLWLRG